MTFRCHCTPGMRVVPAHRRRQQWRRGSSTPSSDSCDDSVRGEVRGEVGRACGAGRADRVREHSGGRGVRGVRDSAGRDGRLPRDAWTVDQSAARPRSGCHRAGRRAPGCRAALGWAHGGRHRRRRRGRRRARDRWRRRAVYRAAGLVAASRCCGSWVGRCSFSPRYPGCRLVTAPHFARPPPRTLCRSRRPVDRPERRQHSREFSARCSRVAVTAGMIRVMSERRRARKPRPSRHKGERYLVGARISPELQDKVDEATELAGTTRNDWIMAAILLALEHPTEMAAMLPRVAQQPAPLPFDTPEVLGERA